MGLAVASDVGIAAQTLALAVMLHGRRMVSLASLDYAEMGRCLTAAVGGGAAAWGAARAMEAVAHWLRAQGFLWAGHARGTDAVMVIAGCAVWLAVAKWALEKTGSALPRITMKRLGLA
jgi:putative peptidoglycan lipid II flippase